MHPLRLRFKKCGRAKYISHLDLMRAFTRAVRRADLPLWYTEGFHPHVFLSFPLPLPLGQESLCEAVDLRLESPVPPDEIAARMQTACPEGITIVSAGEPWCAAGEIAQAVYDIAFTFENPRIAEVWLAQAEDLLRAGELTAVKTGKQGRRKVQKEIALAPMIAACAFERADCFVRCRGTFAAGSEKNLNPVLLCEALNQNALAPIKRDIVRTALLKSDGDTWE
ncbi:MAG: TIGR03936 family radical SAM-associated protein [Oscillospiraceae bacterium]|jgi:radical SAM-linked protein|nr:TIGR03936 family radical SAM-associated protein [Oscillospiraceae bacterium]